MLQRVWREPLRSAPGDHFGYSNVGYCVLAALVEKVTHQPFEDWVKRELFRRAGMSDSGFLGDPDLDADRAAPRAENDDDRRHHDTALRWPWHWAFRGATGVVTTVGDLYAWDRALYSDHVLPLHTRNQLFKPTVEDYAYGWVSTRTPRGTTALGHDGLTYGFRSMLMRYPDEAAVIVIAAAKPSDVRGLEAALSRVLFDAGPDPELLAACAGRYRLPSGGEVDLQAEGGRLLLRPVRLGRDRTSGARHRIAER